MWRSLLWKEWREVRVFVPVGAVLAVLMLVMGDVLGSVMGIGDRWFLGSATSGLLGLPLIGLLAGGGLIATEVQGGTNRFLVALPVRRSRVWWAKVVAAAGSLLAVAATVSLVSVAFLFVHRTPLDKYDDVGQCLTTGTALSILAFLAGTCASALSRTPMNAVGGGLILSALAVGVMWVSSTWVERTAMATGQSWLVLVFPALVVLAIVLAAATAFIRGGDVDAGRPRSVGGRLLAGSLAALIVASLAVGSWRPTGAPAQGLAFVHELSPSPGGSRLLIGTGSGQPGGAGLWTVTVEGKEPQLIDSAGGGRWSPDGRMVAYLSDRGIFGCRHRWGKQDVWVWDSATREHRRLDLPGGPPHSSIMKPPLWSPDGASLLVVRSIIEPQRPVRAALNLDTLDDIGSKWRRKGEEVWVASVRGNLAKRVATSPDDEADTSYYPVGWASDGRAVYVSSRRGVHRVDVDSLRMSPIRQAGPSMRVHFVPGGRKFLVEAGWGVPSFHVMDEDGTDVTEVALPTGLKSAYVALSPNGRYAACIAVEHQGAQAHLLLTDLESMETDEIQDVVPSAEPEQSLRWPAWSPDSKRLAVGRNARRGREPEWRHVDVLSVPSGRVLQTFRAGGTRGYGGVSGVRWVDAERLAFWAGQDVWVADVSTGEVRHVFPPALEAHQ